uniref:Chitin-binding type-2 domain-containing protein n=1 Tax=Heterorhabditis bacteriophora TaxID=37862 RepID=A0A1I7W712_HETBA
MNHNCVIATGSCNFPSDMWNNRNRLGAKADVAIKVLAFNSYSIIGWGGLRAIVCHCFMLLLFLLTLTKGISAGLRAERNCRNLPDGVYTTISCDSEFFQCQKGSLHIRACPQGLYFNSDLNKCDYDYTIEECVVEKGINCSKKNDGIYSAGCTSTFFYCSNGVIHHDRCQQGLFYDSERHMCDHKYRVRTCGGNPEFKNEPITRAPVAVPTYAATALRGYMENS